MIAGYCNEGAHDPHVKRIPNGTESSLSFSTLNQICHTTERSRPNLRLLFAISLSCFSKTGEFPRRLSVQPFPFWINNSEQQRTISLGLYGDSSRGQ